MQNRVRIPGILLKCVTELSDSNPGGGNLFVMSCSLYYGEAELELDCPCSPSDSTGKTLTQITCCVACFTIIVFAFPGLQYLTTQSWQST